MLDGFTSEEFDGVAKLLTERFRAYASSRSDWEEIWRECWDRYTLTFKPEMDATEGQGGRSDAVSGLGRRKVKIFAAFMYDQLFGQGKLPFDLGNTPLPDFAIQHANGQLEKGAFDFLNSDEERMEGMKDLITDQLTEGKWHNEVHSGLIHMGLFGAAVIEGPIIESRTRVEYMPKPIPAENILPQEDGKPDPASITPHMAFERRTYQKPFPLYKFRDIWDTYPDLTCEDPQEGEGIFVLDELKEYDLAALTLEIDEDSNSRYNKDAIQEIINSEESGNQLEIDRGPHRQKQTTANLEGKREDRSFYVITYHGKLSRKDLDPYMEEDWSEDQNGFRSVEDYIPKEVIVTFCQGKVIGYELNEHPRGERQIKIAPTMKLPGSPFGWSVIHEMKEPEKMFNSFLRLFADNKREAAYVDKIIDDERITNPDEVSSFGRRWKVQPGASTDNAVQYLVKPDVSQNCLEILNFCEQWCNAASNIPAFLEGDDVQTTSNTAYEVSEQKNSAMKMLGLTLQSLDEHIIVPCVESLYFWNMDYAEDDTIKGDFEIKATGQQNFRDNVIVANYIRQILEIASSNEEMAAKIDYEKAISLYTKTTGVGLDEIIKTPEKEAEEAQQMQQAQQAQMQAQMQAMQAQSETKIQEELAKIQATHQSQMEQLMAKHQSEMALLGAKIASDEDKALLNSEDKQREQGLKALQAASKGGGLSNG